MSDFYCGICGKNSDETEANFWRDQIVCTPCYGTIKEDEEITNDPRQNYDPEMGYYDGCEHNENPYECDICGIQRKKSPSEKERREVQDLYGGSME